MSSHTPKCGHHSCRKCFKLTLDRGRGWLNAQYVPKLGLRNPARDRTPNRHWYMLSQQICGRLRHAGTLMKKGCPVLFFGEGGSKGTVVCAVVHMYAREALLMKDNKSDRGERKRIDRFPKLDSMDETVTPRDHCFLPSLPWFSSDDVTSSLILIHMDEASMTCP
jgi:hypothetical protein